MGLPLVASGARHRVEGVDVGETVVGQDESFVPTEVNDSTGGSTPATVKNECGARFATPDADSVDT